MNVMGGAMPPGNAGLQFQQLFALVRRIGIKRAARGLEHDAAAGSNGAAADGRAAGNAPALGAGSRVVRHQEAAVAVGANRFERRTWLGRRRRRSRRCRSGGSSGCGSPGSRDFRRHVFTGSGPAPVRSSGAGGARSHLVRPAAPAPASSATRAAGQIQCPCSVPSDRIQKSGCTA